MWQEPLDICVGRHFGSRLICVCIICFDIGRVYFQFPFDKHFPQNQETKA